MISPGTAPEDQARPVVWMILGAKCAGDGLNGMGGDSLSLTIMLVAPLLNPNALAVTVTVCGPSTSVSSITVGLNVPEVWPARMVIVGGTVNSVVSDDNNETVRFVVRVLKIRTVPAFGRVPSPSRAAAGRVTTRLVLSCTMTMAWASVQFGTCAVMVAD